MAGNVVKTIDLAKVTQGTQQRFFMYDSLSRLIRADNPEQETLSAYGIDGELVAEYAADSGVGTPQKENGYRGGTGGTAGQRYAIWPLWQNNGHAGAGISVGTNGVSVYESADFTCRRLWSIRAASSGGTHVTLVYENKQPKLYLNGTLVRTGLTSPMSFVNMNPLELGGDVYGYYSGKLDDVRVYNRALSASEVSTLANVPTSTQIRWLVPDHLGTPRIILRCHGCRSLPQARHQ